MTVVLGMLLRAKKVILLSFCIIFAVLLLLLAIKPDKYQAHMSFLIRNERAESLISADPSQNAVQQADVTEERVNSEVELLGSTELLQAVVLDNHLEQQFLNSAKSNRDIAIERATRDLSKHLTITGVRKSNVIDITYTSPNRDQAKRVLDSLAKEYLSQYARLHNVGGAAVFYRTKSEALAQSLQQARNQRANLLSQNGYMLLPDGQRIGLQEVADLQNARAAAQASLAETESRLQRVRAQQDRNADRILTQRKLSADQLSVEQLTTRLSDLNNRLTELRTKFVDTDPLVTQVEQEIAGTKASLRDAQGMHSEDTTTDINPVRQSLDSEANQLSQSESGLLSRLKEIDRQAAQKNIQLATLEHARIDVDNLGSNIKVLQDSVDLYRGKALAAGASEEMDPEKFSNVVEQTHPTVPVLPASSGFNPLSSFALALLLSVAIGLFSEWRKMVTGSRAERSLPVFQTAGRA